MINTIGYLLQVQSIITPTHDHSIISPLKTEITNHTVCPTVGGVSVTVSIVNGKVTVNNITSKYRTSNTDDLSAIDKNIASLKGLRQISIGCIPGVSVISVKGVSGDETKFRRVSVTFIWDQGGAKYFDISPDYLP